MNPLIYSQVGQTQADTPLNNEAVYTFTGGLRGAGLEFEFNLFGLAQSEPDYGSKADNLLREAARHLLSEIYLPLLPWDAIDRPNPQEALSTVIGFDKEHIEATIFATFVDQYVYLAWHGKAQAYHLSEEDGIEPVVSEDETGITSLTIEAGEYILLCASGICPKLSTDRMHQIIYQAPNLFDACNQLAGLAEEIDEVEHPVALLIHRPPG